MNSLMETVIRGVRVGSESMSAAEHMKEEVH